MTTINIRIDEKLKKEASRTLASIGIDTSSAIKIFLTQVVTEKGLPFVPSKDPAKIRARWDRQVADVIKNGRNYKNGTDALADL